MAAHRQTGLGHRRGLDSAGRRLYRPRARLARDRLHPQRRRQRCTHRADSLLRRPRAGALRAHRAGAPHQARAVRRSHRSAGAARNGLCLAVRIRRAGGGAAHAARFPQGRDRADDDAGVRRGLSRQRSNNRDRRQRPRSLAAHHAGGLSAFPQKLSDLAKKDPDKGMPGPGKGTGGRKRECNVPSGGFCRCDRHHKMADCPAQPKTA